jgi:hypothetical protein
MLEVVDLFREKGTLDELGIGSIRDAFADRFFPGTSTIQTRVRYFLFIPWIYQQIEAGRVPSDQAGSYARWQQNQLAESLKRGEHGDQRGIIGRQAGESLKRPPATIYWNGLGAWGIRLYPGSSARYHASLDHFYRASGASGVAESGELVEARRRNWQIAIPPPPDGLLESTEFRLRHSDAHFLSHQIGRYCDGSLLAACLQAPKTTIRKARTCWDLIDLPNLDPTLRSQLADSRRFACLLEGAVLLYNLMLAEKQAERAMQQSSEWVDRYRAQLDRWADEMVGMQDDLRAWDLDRFQQSLHMLNPRIPYSAFTFCRAWMTAAREAPRSVGDQPALRVLIETRERQLKGALARLSSVRALEKWSGASGLGRLDYRWGISRPMILDIFEGLSSSPEPG